MSLKPISQLGSSSFILKRLWRACQVLASICLELATVRALSTWMAVMEMPMAVWWVHQQDDKESDST